MVPSHSNVPGIRTGLCHDTYSSALLIHRSQRLFHQIALHNHVNDTICLMLTVKSLGVLFLIFLGFVFTGNLPLSAITGSLALTIISVIVSNMIENTVTASSVGLRNETQQ